MRPKPRKVLVVATGIFLCILFLMWSVTVLNEDPEEDETLLRYQPPPQSGVLKIGRKLKVNRTYLGRKSLKYLTLTAELAEDFVIVTAASSSYYGYSLSSISTVQQILPDRPLFFYDLTERNWVDKFVARKFNALCGMTYRQFNFSRYPDHVRKLKNYSWKPLIIYEMLKEFQGVLWIDSSIRFITNNLTSTFQKAVESEGMLALTSAGHSNFAVTHPQMYSYLPTSRNGMFQTDQHEANCVLLYRTKPAFENVVWWWMLCALDPLCIAPTDLTGCLNPYRSRDAHAGCHRFDQSALNILLANYFAFDYKRYLGSGNVVEVHRYSAKNEDIMVCLPGVARTSKPSNNYLLNSKKPSWRA